MKLTLKGSSSSGWYAPGRGTHTGEKHRAVGSGKAGKKPTEKSLAERMVHTPSGELWMTVDRQIVMGGKTSGMGTKKYEAKCQRNMEKFLSESEVSVRTPTEVVEFILKSGRLKNQHETTTSRGTYDPTYRQEAESKAFNIEVREEPGSYPIYGYMSHPSNPETARMYGDVEFVLKSSVRDRTTFTVGDSLSNFAYDNVGATPVNKPGKMSWDRNARYVYENQLNRVGYVEAQIHGGISLADVDHVVMHTRSAAISYYYRATAALEAAGISVTRDER